MLDIKHNNKNKNKIQSIKVSIEGTKNILFQMENCICDIYIKNAIIGIGFFCKIPFNNKLLPGLITNSNILNKNNKIIKLIINKVEKEIKIDNSRQKYFNLEKSLTIIEIKPNKDKIYNYLDLDENEIYKENIELEYNKKPIYMIQKSNEEVSVSYGIMNDIKNNKK